MSGRTYHLRVLALLFGIIFLAAQFHYCADVTSTATGSHICPLCSSAGSVIAPQAANLLIATIVNRLEVVAVTATLFLALPHATSPRAPPSL
jgi:uncharacterized membrane protein (DUF4010 family)